MSEEDVRDVFVEAQRLPENENLKRNMVGTCDNCSDTTYTEDVGGGRRLCYHCREDNYPTEPWEHLDKIKETFK